MTLFRVRGIEVRLDYSWFLIFALILASLSAGYFPNEHPDQSTSAYWVAGAAATLLFFLSILAHELSHAAMARRAGLRVPAITLFLFGGVSQIEEDAHDPGTELRVAAIGPLTSFALAAVFWGVAAVLPDGFPVLGGAVVTYLAWINAALGVFNLLPGYPLDGGRVLRAVVWRATGSLRRATRMASDAGQGLALGLMLLGGLQIFSGGLVGGLWLILIGMFLRSLARAGYRNLVVTQVLEDVETGEVAIADPITVDPGLSIADFVDDYLLEYGYRGYPVVEAGRVRGMISVDEVRGLPPEKRGTTPVRERMHALDDSLRVAPDVPLRRALKRLEGAPGGRLLVMRGDQLVGLLTKGGLARFVEIRNLLEED
jgi:Zn-dependent protease/CBS domain-containing protein